MTRADVAKAAGVSPAVVSYVLNNGPRPVSAHARERVLQAVAELAYRPDGTARSLRLGSTRSLGFVVPDIRVPSFATLMQLVTQHAFEAGKQLLVATSNASLEAERRQLSELAERRVGGVILMSVDPDAQANWVGTLGMPVVLVDRPVAMVRGAGAAVEHCRSHGRQRIGVISSTSTSPVPRRRLQGAQTAIEAHGGRLAEGESLIFTDPTGTGGYLAAGELLAKSPRIDAVLIDTEAQAHGFVRAARNRGIRIPDDVAVITFEAMSEAARFRGPTLTTVNSPLVKIARQAVDRLLGADESARLLALDDVEYEFIARESCGCAHDLFPREVTRIRS